VTDDLDHLRAQLFADRIQLILDENHLLKQRIERLESGEAAIAARLYALEKKPTNFRCDCDVCRAITYSQTQPVWDCHGK
jgi:hypothetical protein